MAALSISPLYHCKHKPNLLQNSRNNSRKLNVVSCQNRDPIDPSDSKGKKERKEEETGLKLHKLMGGVEKLGEVLQDNLSPKQKGDWKDVTLISLSFAVYLYMSQKIVCAYCAWMSMPHQQW